MPTIRRERLKRSLTGSPEFGERWGRHWLDIARYAQGEECSATFEIPIAHDGVHEVRVSYTPHPNRIKAATYSVRHRDGSTEVQIDQTQPPPVDGMYASLGRFPFTMKRGGTIVVGSAGNKGALIIDAVKLIRVESESESNDAEAFAQLNEVQSQLANTFDYKPMLEKHDGERLDFKDARKLAKTGMSGQETVMKSPWRFRQYGQSGRWVSELFPEIATVADDLCFIHSLHTNGVAHGPSTLFLHTGATNVVRPSIGSWVTYGLGTENQNLPGFITISPSADNACSPVEWRKKACVLFKSAMPTTRPIPAGINTARSRTMRSTRGQRTSRSRD